MDRGTVDEVRQMSSECLRNGAENGGFILMPGCDHPPTVSDENLEMFYTLAKNYTD